MTAQISAYGRLVADPQTRTTNSGTSMAMARLAVSLPCNAAEAGEATFVVLLHTESWVMKLAVVAFAGFLAFAALQFGTIVHSSPSLRAAGAGGFVYPAGKESR